MESSRSKVADVITRVERKGARLWVEQGRLVYRAPKGALSPGDLDELRAVKDQIVSYLEARTGESVPDTSNSQRGYQLPLSFSQLAHWNLYRLHDRPGIRQVATATCLRGRLEVDVLEKSLKEVVRRHDALRTRIVVNDGTPNQEVSPSVSFELQLNEPAAATEGSLQRQIEEFLAQPIDVTSDPLFAAKLFRLGENEHCLLLAAEHLISDGYSISILLQEIFAAYEQGMKCEEIRLPAVSCQFTDYVAWQQRTQALRAERNSKFWQELMRVKILRFPSNHAQGREDAAGWGAIPIKVGKELNKELHELCRTHKTTLPLVAFTIYSGAVLRWCQVPDGIIQYQGDGRFSAELERTVGYVASILYLHVGLEGNKNFVDLLKDVTKAYCAAYERNDFCYLESRLPRPEVARNTAFNWIPKDFNSEPTESSNVRDTLDFFPISFEHPIMKKMDRDDDPVILLKDTGEDIVGEVCFPLRRFSRHVTLAFANSFLALAQAIVMQPNRPLSDIPLAPETR